MLDHRIMHPDLFLLAEGDFENVMCFDILKDSAFAITSILEPLQFPVKVNKYKFTFFVLLLNCPPLFNGPA